MRTSLSFAVLFFGFFLLGLAHWIGVSFDNPSIDQILFHLRYSEGIGIDIGQIFLLTFIAECLVIPLVLAVAGAVLRSVLLRLWTRSPAQRRVASGLVPALAASCGVAAMLLKLSVFSWVGYHFAEDRFSASFVDPARVQFSPVRRKNLVLVYVESLEVAYADSKTWGRDLLEPLKPLGGVSFDSYRQAAGANWTIAAIVATQCGVPLRIVSQFDVKAPPPGSRSFMPRATCLGDVLHSHGYRNVFMGGAPLSFAGKGRFFLDHHYDETYGRRQWLAKGIDRRSFGEWGLFDGELFAQAKLKLQELHAVGQPFNLTLLTLDTHNPHGFLSPSCRAAGVRDFQGIVECTSRQLADFVRFVEQSGYLADTQVVILGDHLAVSNPVFGELQKQERRRIFNRFISSAPPVKNREELRAFDMYPSILEFVGIRVTGHRLGLGHSAFAGPAPEAAGAEEGDIPLPSLSGSSAYQALWEPE